VAYITIKNKTDFDISFLKQYAQKLKPFLGLVDKSKYPFNITVVKKKDFYDRSSFDVASNSLTLKIDLSKQSKEDVAWVLIHELTHFLTQNNPELAKIAFSKENDLLEKILKNKFKVSDAELSEVFHDLLSYEIIANFLATVIIGKFHKRHPISNITKFLNGNRNGNNEKK
jgi:uncharacterized protein YlxP (DUF503 family)